MAPAKYRPQTFAEVIGQERVVKTLQNALRTEKAGAAYLFSGTRGTGKTSLARLLAKTLCCHAPIDRCEPCNACSSCQAISEGYSLDVIEIDGASNRGIDDIRQINETVGFAPSGRWKIYIIDEVHMLTKEAFNALLKTLEEPPPHVKFFFATTEPHKIPQTILSRLQRFDLRRLSEGEIAQKLQRISPDLDPKAAHLIASLSEGALRDAESLFEQIHAFADGKPIDKECVAAALGLALAPDFAALDQAIHAYNLAFPFPFVDALYERGVDLNHFLEQLILHYRNLTRLKLCGPPESAPLFSQDQLLFIFDILTTRLESVHRSPLRRFELEDLLLKLIRSSRRLPLDAIAKQLLDLQKTPTPKNTTHSENLLRFASVELNGIVKQG